jgi:predicted SnoaL-like aldol condensation-catalyzing enzyme
MPDSSSTTHKEAAVQFLQLVVAGSIDEAYEAHVDLAGQHHNPFFPAGFPALKQAMKENQVRFPDSQITVKHALGDGDLVAVHSHVVLSLGTKGVAVVHLFRFQDDKIVELWDVGQAPPEDSPNADGMF